MTWAICFNCGSEKFGAWCRCPTCGTGSSGDLALDMAFSTHHMSRGRLAEFGAVVKALHEKCQDNKVCTWAFLKYVSDHHPEILKVEVPTEFEGAVKVLLSEASIPPVSERRWWQFWRR